MHDPNMAALFADDVIMISKGSIMACGPSEEVMTERNISDLYGTCINSVQLTAGKKIFFPDNIFRNTDQ
jgi:iron complex transport system ATP-binding protein